MRPFTIILMYLFNYTKKCVLNDQIMQYRISRTIGRYLFSSTRWLRPIVHIDLYKDEAKKIWNPSKKILMKMTILFAVYLYFAVGFFF
jgi:preprotein translocase subunit SecE